MIYIFKIITHLKYKKLGRVPSDDLDRVSKATGAAVQTSVFGITDKILGNIFDVFF